MHRIHTIGALALLGLALVVPARAEASLARVAALQSALRSFHLYRGVVDGVDGPLIRRAVIALQRRQGLPTDGVAGPRTRRALGWRGSPELGSRAMRVGTRGRDVAALQFLLQRAGDGVGRADGVFGPLTEAAVKRAQGAAGIHVDGVAGADTVRALRRGGEGSGDQSAPDGDELPEAAAGPRFSWPVAGPIGDGFGSDRGDHLHTGIDFPVPFGTPVTAAGAGTIIFAGRNSGGYGNLVVAQHRLGYTTWYAHLSSIGVAVGGHVPAGVQIGAVGSTGRSTGPHLHFEVRRYDTPIDPLPLLAPRAAGRPIASIAGISPLDGCGVRPRPARPAVAGDWIADERICALRSPVAP